MKAENINLSRQLPLKILSARESNRSWRNAWFLFTFSFLIQLLLAPANLNTKHIENNQNTRGKQTKKEEIVEIKP